MEFIELYIAVILLILGLAAAASRSPSRSRSGASSSNGGAKVWSPRSRPACSPSGTIWARDVSGGRASHGLSRSWARLIVRLVDDSWPTLERSFAYSGIGALALLIAAALERRRTAATER